jgi:hypothetical protein
MTASNALRILAILAVIAVTLVCVVWCAAEQNRQQVQVNMEAK